MYSAFDTFRSGSQHANADVLSNEQILLPDHPSSFSLPQKTVLLMKYLQMPPVTAQQTKS